MRIFTLVSPHFDITLILIDTTPRNIRRIIFQSLMKSDGNAVRNLSPAHARQVAGRAGRFGKEHSKGFVTT